MLKPTGQPKQALQPRLALAGPHGDHLDDLFEAHIANCQRKSAQRMLQDFEKAGVDEDLEQLKAGWAPSFGRRPGFPPPKQASAPRQPATRAICTGIGLHAIANETSGSRHRHMQEDNNCVSNLAMQAEMARDRLEQLESLRCIAGSPTSDSSIRSGLKKHCFLSLRGAPSSQVLEDDPWVAWEGRWSQEFQHFNEFERARHEKGAADAETEYRRREAQWQQKVQHAKSQAEEAAARRRQAAQPRAKEAHEPRRPPEAQRQEESKRAQDPGGQRPRQSQKPPQEPRRPGASEEQHARKEQQGSGRSAPKPPPQEPRRPGASEEQYARKEQQGSGRSAPKSGVPGPAPRPPVTSKAPTEQQFRRFSDFDAAWSSFEARVSAGQSLRYADVPWPTSLPTISGAEASDGSAERKQKLRAALVRWHPDKWGVIFGLVHEDDQQLVMERVKEVTRRIIDERKTFGG